MFLSTPQKNNDDSPLFFLLQRLPADIVYHAILPYAYQCQPLKLLDDIRHYAKSMHILRTSWKHPPMLRPTTFDDIRQDIVMYMYWHRFEILQQYIGRLYPCRTYTPNMCRTILRKIERDWPLTHKFNLYWRMISPHEREISMHGLQKINGVQ